MSASKFGKFQPTWGDNEWGTINWIEWHGDHQAIFDAFPLKSIRLACVERFREYVSPDAIPWLEQRISDVYQHDREGGKEIAERMLRYYLFARTFDRAPWIESPPELIQAITFALRMKGLHGWAWSGINKIVIDRIKDRPDLYSQIPDASKIIYDGLDAWDPRTDDGEKSWKDTERALRLLVVVKDISFRDRLKEWVTILEQRLQTPEEPKEELARAQDPFFLVRAKAAIEETLRIL